MKTKYYLKLDSKEMLNLYLILKLHTLSDYGKQNPDMANELIGKVLECKRNTDQIIRRY